MEENIKDYIIDASFMLSFLLPDEENKYATDIFIRYKERELRLFSSNLLIFEVLNTLKVCTIRKRISISDARRLAQSFLTYNLDMLLVDYYDALNISISHNISYYDASYVALSKITSYPLLTLDKKLKSIANKIIANV